jgi:hypothetical protein
MAISQRCPQPILQNRAAAGILAEWRTRRPNPFRQEGSPPIAVQSAGGADRDAGGRGGVWSLDTPREDSQEPAGANREVILGRCLLSNATNDKSLEVRRYAIEALKRAKSVEVGK